MLKPTVKKKCPACHGTGHIEYTEKSTTITEAQRVAALRMLKENVPTRQIAKILGLAPGTIHFVKKRYSNHD